MYTRVNSSQQMASSTRAVDKQPAITMQQQTPTPPQHSARGMPGRSGSGASAPTHGAGPTRTQRAQTQDLRARAVEAAIGIRRLSSPLLLPSAVVQAPLCCRGAAARGYVRAPGATVQQARAFAIAASACWSGKGSGRAEVGQPHGRASHASAIVRRSAVITRARTNATAQLARLA